jgi:hypothetical protein
LDSLLSILTRTTDLKEILQKSLLDKPSISSKLRKQKGKINLEIKNKQVELEKLINSIVEVEKNNLLNVYTSNNVYVELKYQLNKQFKKCKIELENLNNSLKYYSQRDTWFKTLESFSELIKSTPIWDDKKKKEVLVHLLDKVILKHDPTTLLHTLDLHLRIPLILTPTKKGNTLRVPIKNLMKPLLNQVDQLCTVEDYSTVTLFAKLRG